MAWRPSYDEVRSTGGMVTAPDTQVSEAGAEILRRGGNAVDAAVAAAFADGVVQPSMAGVGGSTFLVIGHAESDRYVSIDGNMVTPAAARPEEYPLAETPPGAASFYGWPPVEGDANVVGPRSVAVPGSVPALAAAHEQFGSLPLGSVLEPAVRLAADGVEVNWFFASVIASEARHLRDDEGCASTFLDDGLPLRGPGMSPADRLVQPQLARTLEELGREGPELFRTGRVAEAIVERVRAGGGLLTLEDLAAYRPFVTEAALARFDGHLLAGVPGTGFPSVVEALNLFAAGRSRDPGTHESVLWARALMLALLDRSRYGSTDPERPAPWEELCRTDYARARLEAHLTGGEPPSPGERSGAGAADDGVGGAGATTEHGHTSHVSAVDAAGTMVSVTQTLLNEFGARLLEPETGVVLNDGMAFFDPRPGSANSIGPGRRALSAMCPIVMAGEDGPMAAFGASGGPRIVSGVAQMVVALAEGRSMQEACEEARIHAGARRVLLDERAPDDAVDALHEAGIELVFGGEGPTTVTFARPNGVLIGSDGVRRSGLDPNKPGGASVA